MTENEKMNDYGMVSIVMLSKDQAQYVEESVRSVMAQTYKNRELLFVDDNSKDDTVTKMMNLKGNNDYALWLQESYCRMSYDDKKYVLWCGEVDEIR